MSSTANRRTADLAVTGDLRAEWEVVLLPEMNPVFVRRRFEFLLATCARNSIAQMVKDTGVPKNVLNHAINKSRTTISLNTIAAVCKAYQVGLDFPIFGQISDLPDELQTEVAHWIRDGRWDVEAKAPAEDRKSLRKT